MDTVNAMRNRILLPAIHNRVPTENDSGILVTKLADTDCINKELSLLPPDSKMAMDKDILENVYGMYVMLYLKSVR